MRDHHNDAKGKHWVWVLSALFLASSPWSVCSAACTMCEDGSFPSLPNLVVDIPPLGATSCSHLHTVLPLLLPDEGNDFCVTARRLESFCGCPRRSDACNLCPDGSPVVHKHLELPEFPPLTEASLFTCELLEAYMHSFSESDKACAESRQTAAEKCGCTEVANEPTNSSMTLEGADIFVGNADSPLFSDPSLMHITYFGAQSFADLKTLQAILRTGAALSILGALLVIQDSVRSQKRRNCLYNRIVAIMAAFDIVYTIAVALLNIPSPTDDIVRHKDERGNQATCKAQGWFIQWGGMTSLFLNASLSTYYILVIVHNRKETRLKAAAKWLIGVPIVAGLVLAFASIPFISTSIHGGCHIPPPSSSWIQQLTKLEGSTTSSWIPYLGLYIVPAYVVIAYTTAALLRVYLHVRTVNKKANRWRIPIVTFKSDARTMQEESSPGSSDSLRIAGTNSGRRQQRRHRSSASVRSLAVNLQKELAIQSAMYLVALYLSWFVYLVLAVNLDKYLLSNYPLWCFVYFLIPLQGFLNSLTYFRPRLTKLLTYCCRRAWVRRRKPQQVPTGEYNTNNAAAAIFSDNTGNENSRSNNDWAAVIEPAADLEVMLEDSTAPFETKRSLRINSIAQVEEQLASAPSQRESSLSSSTVHSLDRPQELGGIMRE